MGLACRAPPVRTRWEEGDSFLAFASLWLLGTNSFGPSISKGSEFLLRACSTDLEVVGLETAGYSAATETAVKSLLGFMQGVAES